ncbi:hypothetical protein GAU_1804 [Gemmatimonas aurantiaca T-27]|uniref:Uncharacterized protein n=1 Tax=Gemmatimonas aurantiaca (strain DSM 14586 / JCM 11422 / NBRC 100505 / T-27) TaxID=379066 RepID=C1A421_GEMAT|nr:hypothetical protein [Gemmatimonas aurantiaca]BAH38846.1 hypothetical protein GAU_1804 [Gemmatimonas aurantiaca T-27]
MSTFQEEVTKAVEASVLKQIREGGVVSLPYEQRLKIDGALLREAYANIDRDAIRGRITQIIEERIGDLIWNALATELTNDVKQILSNKELREEVRGVLREQIRKAADAVKVAP